jgi:hypothetical protein
VGLRLTSGIFVDASKNGIVIIMLSGLDGWRQVWDLAGGEFLVGDNGG